MVSSEDVATVKIISNLDDREVTHRQSTVSLLSFSFHRLLFWTGDSSSISQSIEWILNDATVATCLKP